MEQDDRPRMHPPHQFIQRLLSGGLAVLIPIHVG